MKKLLAALLLLATPAAYACYTYTTSSWKDGKYVMCTCVVCDTHVSCNCY